MRHVPYHNNPGNACALACYTMVAQFLFPEEKITFEQISNLSDWHKGYIVWGFSFWKWIMDMGVKITNYDCIDMDVWVEQGIEGLKKSVPEKEFKFYQENTYSLDNESYKIKNIYSHKNFTYIKKKVDWQDIVIENKKSGICDLTVDGRKLHNKEGFTVHRVVILDITDREVIFHDPVEDNSGSYAKEDIRHFKTAMESLGGAELTRYSLE